LPGCDRWNADWRAGAGRYRAAVHPLASQTDVRQLAVDHCARYDKVVKFLAVDAQYGGYISFACRWVPYGANDRPLVTRY
jgi:hypothetical protein